MAITCDHGDPFLEWQRATALNRWVNIADRRVELVTFGGQDPEDRGLMVRNESGNKGQGMTSRGEGTINTAALRTLTHRLGDGTPRYAPAAHDATAGLPDRTPGEALARPSRTPVGPRAIILDCGTSRKPGYSHVLWISPAAESMLGSHLMDSFGLIMGRVVGVEAYLWEGTERLHVRAPGLGWEALLRDAQDALAGYLASA